MAAQTSPVDKQAFLNRMLSDFSVVRIHFGGTGEDVRIPNSIRQAAIIFDLGLNMPVPIPDMVVNEHGVYATLSFNRCPFSTFVPWQAIFAISDKDSGKGLVWPQDVPVALKQGAKKESAPPVKTVRPASLRPAVSHLRLVR